VRALFEYKIEWRTVRALAALPAPMVVRSTRRGANWLSAARTAVAPFQGYVEIMLK
jgi:hypothetical protein